MKQDMLQMLKCISKNEKVLRMLIGLLVKYIKKIIGPQKRGKSRLGLAKVVSGILYYVRTGCTWRFLPTVFGCHQSISGWFQRLSSLEAFRNLWTYSIQFASEKGVLNLKDLLCDGSLAMTNSSISIKSKNPRIKNKNCVNRIFLTDLKGITIGLLLVKGTANDTKFLLPILDQAKAIIHFPKRFKVHSDKGFDSLENRWGTSLRNGFADIPVRNQGYTTEYPIHRDKKRPIVEHSIAWLNAFKSLKIITAKKLENLHEMYFIALLTILMRFLKLKDIKTLIQKV